MTIHISADGINTSISLYKYRAKIYTYILLLIPYTFILYTKSRLSEVNIELMNEKPCLSTISHVFNYVLD